MTSPPGELTPAPTTVAAASAALRDAEADLSATDATLAKLNETVAAAHKRLEQGSTSIVLNRSQLTALQTQKRQCQVQLMRHADGLAAREQRLLLSRDCLMDTSQKMEVLRLRHCHATESLRARSSDLGVLGARLTERRQQLRSLQTQILMTRLKLGQGRYPPSQRRASAFNAWRVRIAESGAMIEAHRRAALRWRAAQLLTGLRNWQAACSREARRSSEVRHTTALANLQVVNERRLRIQIDSHAAGKV